jgi:uncharacterized protein YdaU (DUF1376 family)
MTLKKKSQATYLILIDLWLGSSSINAMTPAEEGAYLRLLLMAAKSGDGSLPDDDYELARMSRLGDLWSKKPRGSAITSGERIRQRFSVADGRLRHHQVDADRQRFADAKQQRSHAAEARWGKRKQCESDAAASLPHQSRTAGAIPSSSSYSKEHTNTREKPEEPESITARCRIQGGCTSPAACEFRGACVTETIVAHQFPEGIDGFEVEQLARTLHAQHRPFGDGGGLPRTQRALLKQLTAIRARRPGDSWEQITSALVDRHAKWCEFWAIDRQRDKRSWVPLIGSWLENETYRTEPATAVPA